MLERLATFMASLLPESGQPIRSIRCQYTLTPDRDFVLAPVPGHESVVVGLGAAHGFKFAPTFGRVLADLATSGSTTSDISAFGWTGQPSPTRRTPPTGWCDEPVAALHSSENGGYRSVTRSRA